MGSSSALRFREQPRVVENIFADFISKASMFLVILRGVRRSWSHLVQASDDFLFFCICSMQCASCEARAKMREGLLENPLPIVPVVMYSLSIRRLLHGFRTGPLLYMCTSTKTNGEGSLDILSL